MASDLNTVTIIGRLTRNAELSYTIGGYPICKFSIATNRTRKQGEEWIEEVSYLDIALWGKRGEALAGYLTKGKQVAISGELRQDRWEKDGAKRSKVYIEARNIQLIGGKKDGFETSPHVESGNPPATAGVPQQVNDPAARTPGDMPGAFVAAVKGEEPVF